MRKSLKKCAIFILVLAVILTQVLAFNPTVHAADTANLALGKTITASSVQQTYVATNANDGNVNTYWEGASGTYPNTLTVDLGSAQSVYKVVLKLNPSWGTRTQDLSVLSSTDNVTYTTRVASSTYTFNPSSSNIVTITFTETSARYIRLNFTANSGATGGQVAEFEVYGTASSGTPDLVVTDISWNPASPATGNAVTFSATIKNQGTGATPAGVINGVSFSVDGTQVSWSDNNTSSIAAGASITVTANGGSSGSTWAATSGSHTIMAWVDDVNRIAESNENNNQYSKTLTTGGTTSQPDLTVTDITYSPVSPAVGDAVTFSAVVNNQGTAAGAAGIVAFQVDGTQVATSANSTTSIAAGSTLTVTASGTWTATSGSHTLTAIADNSNTTVESNESNNSYSEALVIGGGGGGATKYEGENASLTGGAKVNTDHTGYSGTGFVDGIQTAGSSTATFTVNVASAGYYDVDLRYANAMGSTRTMSLIVNGTFVKQTSFTNLANWDTWSDKVDTVYLNAGSNTIAYKYDTSDNGNINLDYITVGVTTAVQPDLMITGMTFSPASPVETDTITLTSTVKNNGTASSGATTVKFYLGNSLVGSAPLAPLTAGNSTTVSVNVGPQNAGTYNIISKVDEENSVTELVETNNSYTNPSSLVVNQVPSSDLVGNVSWTPSNPSAGNTVTFTVNLKNQGNVASAGGAHGITLVLKNSAGATVQTYNNSYTGTLAAGASTNVTMGTWTAVNGSYSLTCTVAADANEVAIKQANNVGTASLYCGRGANMPFTVIEAESPSNTTNGTRLAPNFKLADYAGEASGRSAVYLDATGEYVEFTLTAPANAFVLRNAVAENTTGTVSIYANGANKGKFTVTSKFSYVYTTPDNLGQLGYNNTPGGTAYWLYEDSQLMLDQVYPAGTKIKIQKDAGDVPWIYVDLLETENVAPAATNPDPSKYVQVSASKSIEQALNEFRQDSTKLGIFIPTGTWEISNKIFIYGRATQIIGAGPWWTKLTAPQSTTNTDVGFNISSSANGSTIKNLSAWGNYIYRTDGPGKFIDGNGMQHVTVDNVWIEHFICMYWGVGSSYNTFENCRIKNTFADGINMTNGSSYNTIDNCYARATGDDSFALFSAVDAGGSYNVGNTYSNDTAVCTRRAACFAVYGGSNNLYTNLYGADTLTYPGITISSLSFGYNTLGFGDQDCVFDGITLDRTGGDFWTSNGADDKINGYQNFGAIWFFDGDRAFKNILVKNVDINDPVYFGLMFQTKYPEALAMSNIRCENININNPTRYGIKLVVSAEAGQGPCVGGASFTNVKINNAGIAPVYGQSGCPNFIVTKIGTGNNW
jgi:subtilase family serine protease